MKTIYHHSRNVLTLILFMLVIAANTFAQTPQYYNYNNGTSANTYPFYWANGQRVHWLMRAGTLNQPAPCPGGNIDTIYFRMASTVTTTFTNICIKMKSLPITNLPSAWYTTELDTAYFRASVSLSSVTAGWMAIPLDHPIAYDTSEGLVVDVQQCGCTVQGMNVYYSSGTPYTRDYGTPNTGCPINYAGQDGVIQNFGVHVSPAATPSVNRCLLLPTPGVNTNYVMIPNATGMTGFQYITIEGWVKIGGSTTPNTVLNKGGSSFDYQLGINSGTTNPFFRAISTIVIASSVTVTPGVWTHLAVTYDGTNVTFYKNGSTAFTQAQSVTLGSSANEMRIGRGGNDPGSGNIDEIRLWNIARSQSQIAADMCNKWVPNNATGLIGKWHFDSTYTDSVHNWNGTPLGTVGFDTVTWCPMVGIQKTGTKVPAMYKLEQNYPNPFNPTTTIKFSLPKGGYVEMTLYDVTGRQVATLVRDPYQAGTYSVTFDASRLASGVYFYKIVSGDFTDTKKMVLIK